MLRPVVPAAVVVLLLVLSAVLLLTLIDVLLLFLAGVLLRVLLLPLTVEVLPALVVILLPALALVLLLVLGAVLLLLAVAALLVGAPLAVLGLLVRLLRLLRVVLRLAAVGGLAVGGLSSPSAVPVQRVLRIPRFGACAPAILSHRSPRAARRWLLSLVARLPSASSLCGGCSNTTTSRGTLPYRDQMTTSTPSPGALPDARSDSRACCRMMTAAA